MKLGIEFSSNTIKESYSRILTQSTESTYSMSSTTTTQITCGGGKRDAKQYGLWQWITETSDKQSQAMTALTVCRSGSGIWN